MEKRLTKKEIDGAYGRLLERARFDVDFVVLLAVSAVICVIGFAMDSTAVIIGAMVVSPLLYPAIAVPAAAARRDGRGLALAGLYFLGGIVLAILISVVTALFVDFDFQAFELISRLEDAPGFYFVVAVTSGVAGTFSFFWPKTVEAVMGVAISIALLPPICMLGIAMADNAAILGTSGLIVLLNVVGVFVGAFVTVIFLRLVKGEKRQKES